jgi:nitrite reductase (NADH) small subunit
MGRVDLGAIDSLEEGEPTIVKSDGREYVLVRWKERVYGLRNVCPHMTKSFKKGCAHELVTGADRFGELRLESGDPVIRCPWHGWPFSLTDGSCLVDPTLRVRAMEIELCEGRILVETAKGQSRDDAASPGGAATAKK